MIQEVIGSSVLLKSLRKLWKKPSWLAITSQMKPMTGKSDQGFVKGKSCLTNLLTFYDTFAGLADGGGQCLLNTNEQYDAATKKSNEIPGYIKMESPALIKVVFIPLSTFEATPEILCCFGPYCAKRCGQAAKDPEKDHKKNQRIGKPVMWGKAVRTGFVQPSDRKLYGRPYQHLSALKGCLQR